MAPPPRILPAQTTGTVDRVPCPSCGKGNDFRGTYETLQAGNLFKCDHCKQPMQVVSIRDVKMVSVRKPGGATTQPTQRRR